MRLWAILAGAAVLAMLAACEPHLHQPTLVVSVTQFPLRSASSCGTNPTGKDFVAAKVHMLADFDFTNNGGTSNGGVYTAPTVLVEQTPDSYATDFAAAFDLAPPYLKTALCQDVDDVFLDLKNRVKNGAPFGWAFWEVPPDQDQGLRRYIAVGGALWTTNPDGTQFGLSDLEMLILNQLLPNTQGKLFDGVEVSGLAAANPRLAALLAVLAREVGLILSNDAVWPKGSCDSDFGNISWSGNVRPVKGVIQLLHDQVPSGDPNTQRRGKSPSPSEILTLFQRSPVAGEQALARIYGAGPATGNVEWADLLADALPTDDVAETYRMMVLRDAGVTHIIVPLKSPQGDLYPDTITNLGRPVLAAKVQCLQGSFVPLPSTSGPPAPAPR